MPLWIIIRKGGFKTEPGVPTSLRPMTREFSWMWVNAKKEHPSPDPQHGKIDVSPGT